MTGWLYFANGSYKGLSLLKFGISENPKERIKQHRCTRDNPMRARLDSFEWFAMFQTDEIDDARQCELTIKRMVRASVPKWHDPFTSSSWLIAPGDEPSCEWLVSCTPPADGALTLLQVAIGSLCRSPLPACQQMASRISDVKKRMNAACLTGAWSR